MSHMSDAFPCHPGQSAQLIGQLSAGAPLAFAESSGLKWAPAQI